jgi:hypothetical protein
VAKATKTLNTVSKWRRRLSGNIIGRISEAVERVMLRGHTTSRHQPIVSAKTERSQTKLCIDYIRSEPI